MNYQIRIRIEFENKSISYGVLQDYAAILFSSLQEKPNDYATAGNSFYGRFLDIIFSKEFQSRLEALSWAKITEQEILKILEENSAVKSREGIEIEEQR
jgi:hypothetical protein